MHKPADKDSPVTLKVQVSCTAFPKMGYSTAKRAFLWTAATLVTALTPSTALYVTGLIIYNHTDLLISHLPHRLKILKIMAVVLP